MIRKMTILGIAALFLALPLVQVVFANHDGNGPHLPDPFPGNQPKEPRHPFCFSGTTYMGICGLLPGLICQSQSFPVGEITCIYDSSWTANCFAIPPSCFMSEIW